MLAQIGRFGIGFIVLPVWLAHQGLDAQCAGLFAASQWAGMLAGLAAAPVLVARIGARRTVSLGLAASIVAFSSIAWLSWPLWIVPGILTGLGIGLSWIANESWKYSCRLPHQVDRGVIGPSCCPGVTARSRCLPVRPQIERAIALSESRQIFGSLLLARYRTHIHIPYRSPVARITGEVEQ
ncbi:MAG TPA: hypothetical protein VJS30_12260 [Paraburkholderia sp.]|nr:hypothetical protein [Paraburkholderia sp.]